MIRRIHIFSLLIVLAFSVNLFANTHVVFSGGRSNYSIILSEDASESEQYAATILKEYIQKTGSTLIPIKGCGEGKKNHRIFVGYSRDVQVLFPEIRKPNPEDESFIYKSNGGDILIIGGCNRGTMYGVFSFLENEMNCRWYTKDCTIIPITNSYTFDTLYFHDSPSFTKRNMMYSEIRDPEFRIHCRINEKLKTAPFKPESQIGGCYGLLAAHTLAFLLPVETFFDTHPEYFALRNGKRKNGRTQPCFTNPAVFTICLSELRRIMKERPEFDIYEVSTLDNRQHCECEQCKMKINQLGNYTDLVLDFVNRIAAEVEESYPNKKIEFSAYQDLRTPPVTIRPRSNVVVRLADVEICHVHGFEQCTSPDAVKYYQDVLNWRKIANELYVWEYASNFSAYNIPYPNFYALQDNLKTYKRLGFKGIMEEGDHYTYNGEFQALRIYVLSKLLWNPDIDIDLVVNDFLNGYYGPASSYMRGYFDLIHSRNKTDDHSTPFAKLDAPYYDSTLISEGLSIFQKAKEAVKDEPELLRRVEMEELSLTLLDCLRNGDKPVSPSSFMKAMNVIERENIDLHKDEFERKIETLKGNVNQSRSDNSIGEILNSWYQSFRQWVRNYI